MTTSRFLLLLVNTILSSSVLLLSVTSPTQAFTTTTTTTSGRPFGVTSSKNHASRISSRVAMSESNSIEMIDLTVLKNHEEDGQAMADSIARWLDEEWIPQEVHVQMGMSAKQSYIKARLEGDEDLMSIMMKVIDDLNNDWDKYNADAFVNAFDIGNYVSDYLVQATGNEGCSCNTPVA